MDEQTITCPTRGLFAELERDHRRFIEIAEDERRDPILELAGFLLVQNARLQHEDDCAACKRELAAA